MLCGDDILKIVAMIWCEKNVSNTIIILILSCKLAYNS